MTTEEIRKMSNEEIVEKIKTTKSELLNLRIANAKGSLEKPHQINVLKKDVARMKTILNERNNVGNK